MNKICEANHTQIPNVVLDYGMNELDSFSFKILIFIYRMTNVHQKKIVEISLNKFMENTLMSKSTICKAIKNLEERKLIIKKMHENKFGGPDLNTYEVTNAGF